MSSVLKPFAKIVGGAPRAQVPEGYEVVKTGTQTSYITGGGYQSSVQRINEQQYERLLQEADRAPVSAPSGLAAPGGSKSSGSTAASMMTFTRFSPSTGISRLHNRRLRLRLHRPLHLRLRRLQSRLQHLPLEDRSRCSRLNPQHRQPPRFPKLNLPHLFQAHPLS